MQLVGRIFQSTYLLTGMLVMIWSMTFINKRYFEYNLMAKLTRIFMTA